ncbi:BtpA/SgcQ family protein [bacterium]|nr:BtpA/SgcQ family protein [bacterium]
MPNPLPPTARRPAVIGMLHVPALPGTPRHDLGLPAILERVAAEAAIYAEAGVDAVLLENMHDVPYLRGAVGPEITACMTAAAITARGAFAGPVGVQVLAGANEAALAVAVAAGLAFVRVEGFVFGHVADEGWLDACAGPLLRERARLGAGHVAILADIKKKHAAHAATADVPLADTARAAEFCGADGVIVSGPATAEPTDPGDVDLVRAACGLPIVVGSGVTDENVGRFLAADAVIVGSAFKQEGHWSGPLEADRVLRFLARLEAAG